MIGLNWSFRRAKRSKSQSHNWGCDGTRRPAPSGPFRGPERVRRAQQRDRPYASAARGRGEHPRAGRLRRGAPSPCPAGKRRRSRTARRSRLPKRTGAPPLPAPRSAMSRSWRRISAVSTPRRRCVGRTPTAETPATGREPPGSVISKENSRVVPMTWSPSNAASVRSRSVMASTDARRSSSIGSSSSASRQVPQNAGNSSTVTGRIGHGSESAEQGETDMASCLPAAPHCAPLIFSIRISPGGAGGTRAPGCAKGS